MKKGLFITDKDILNEIQNGGARVGKRNLDYLCKCLGPSNVYIIQIADNITASDLAIRQVGCLGKSFLRVSSVFESVIANLSLRKSYLLSTEKHILSYVKSIINDIDVVFMDSSLYGALARKIRQLRKIPIIIYMHNIEHDYSLRKVQLEGIKYLPAFFSSSYNERLVMKCSNYIICITERDSSRAEELYKIKPNLILPVTFKDEYKFFARKGVRERVHKKNILFIGSLFPPNYQGVTWFVENVMPKIPDIVLTIVGKGFETKKRQLERENVIVIGSVNDLTLYYQSFPIIVMPILCGDGMKVKTAEALMFGKIIVATDEALVGYDVSDSQDIFRCNTSEEFVSCLSELFQRSTFPVSETNRQLFLEKYEYNSRYSEFKKLMKGVLERG
ncbi:glycosyltransferase [Butyrivibrio sp. FCS006]|uniref:glycosyltransferase n=1 Tax=Butyrivibrio sp. FCS006 TaxID=1280684 RepID=UPI000427443F|nr:glycosyltransferase [Butyrivibrio sp. FCS006]